VQTRRRLRLPRWRFKLRLQLQPPRRSQLQRRLRRRLRLCYQPRRRYSRALRHARPGRTASLFVLEGDHVLDATHIHHQRQPHGLGTTDDGSFGSEINVIGCWLYGQHPSASSKRQLRAPTPGAGSELQLQTPATLETGPNRQQAQYRLQ
jgi:hypothetical protein